jgi:hypothetical protein
VGYVLPGRLYTLFYVLSGYMNIYIHILLEIRCCLFVPINLVLRVCCLVVDATGLVGPFSKSYRLQKLMHGLDRRRATADRPITSYIKIFRNGLNPHYTEKIDVVVF